MFDSDFLKKLEYLSLVSKRVFRGQLLAQRRTRQLGGGVEFADHRDYAPGDDLRYLDWNIFARFEQELIKRFEEEDEATVAASDAESAVAEPEASGEAVHVDFDTSTDARPELEGGTAVVVERPAVSEAFAEQLSDS